MPVCVRCGIMQASAEVSNRSKEGPTCKDKATCRRRRAIIKEMIAKADAEHR